MYSPPGQRLLLAVRVLIVHGGMTASGPQSRSRTCASTSPRAVPPTTLHEFSQQTGLQLLFDYRAVEGIDTRAVTGEANATRALAKMLGGTGLAFEFVNEKTVSVVSMRRSSERSRQCGLCRKRVDHRPRFRHFTGAERHPPPPTRILEPAGLEEVVVTAQKRSESLRDVPISVVSLTAMTLESINAKTFTDIGFAVPGLRLSQFPFSPVADPAFHTRHWQHRRSGHTGSCRRHVRRRRLCRTVDRTRVRAR
jgi:hypothetical protein